MLEVYDLPYHYGEYGWARTLHASGGGGAKILFFFCFFSSVTLSNGEYCERGIAIKSFELTNGFEGVG